MGRRSSEQIQEMLAKAHLQYMEHELRGDDMEQAGRELAEAVRVILYDGPICGMPREQYLRETWQEQEEPLEDLREPWRLDD
jgi:hypothetical protein